MKHHQIIITPRPVTPPDLGDSRWRRFVDTILFRRGLRQRLSTTRDELYAAHCEVEASNQRRTEGASAAHAGMFKIESLGVLSSEVSVRKDKYRTERKAVVEVAFPSEDLMDYRYDNETVSFEGQTYVVMDMTVDSYEAASYIGGRHTTLTLRGVVLNK